MTGAVRDAFLAAPIDFAEGLTLGIRQYLEANVQTIPGVTLDMFRDLHWWGHWVQRTPGAAGGITFGASIEDPIAVTFGWGQWQALMGLIQQYFQQDGHNAILRPVTGQPGGGPIVDPFRIGTHGNGIRIPPAYRGPPARRDKRESLRDNFSFSAKRGTCPYIVYAWKYLTIGTPLDELTDSVQLPRSC